MKQLLSSIGPLMIAMSLTSRGAAALNDGLVHFFPFDGDARDVVGGAAGTLINSEPAPGRSGEPNNAFLFNGANARIQLPDTFLSDGLPLGTVTAWVRIDSFTPTYGGTIINRGIPAYSTSFALGINPEGKLQANLSDRIAPPSLHHVLTGQWVCVAVTWNGDRLKYFIDGQLSGDFPFIGTFKDPKLGKRRVDIGVDDQDVGWFPGTIDEIRMYDRTLSPFEIALIADVPELSTRVSGASQVEICWTSFSNSVYEVQYGSSLTTNTWTALGNPVLATNSTTCIYDAVMPEQAQRYYRVIRLP